VTIFGVLQAMILTLHASLIENSSNDQINSQTKVNFRLKNGRMIHARFLVGGFSGVRNNTVSDVDFEQQYYFDMCDMLDHQVSFIEHCKL